VRDPAAALGSLLEHLGLWLLTWAPVAGSGVALVAVAIYTAQRAWRGRRHQRLSHGARLVTILAPPQIQAGEDGGLALWSTLLGTLRPRWRRLLFGQPHLVWEYRISAHELTIRVWVPGPVSAEQVARAVHAAWPGARTQITVAPRQPTPPPHQAPRSPAGCQVLAAGGRLRLARPPALPLRSEFPIDMLRGLLTAAGGLAGGQHAIVQVLARPSWPPSRYGPRRLLHRVLDALLPGAATTTTRSQLDRVAALELNARDRAIVGKRRGAAAGYTTSIRYAVSTTVPADAHPQLVQDTTEKLRTRAHALAGAFAPYGSEHNYYRTRRLRHPLVAITNRAFPTHGDLLSVPELAALAHLPTDLVVAGMARAGAASVPPPPGIPTPGPGVIPIGVTDGPHPQPVGVRIQDAAQHFLLVGPTGSGKSWQITHQVLHAATHGRGLVNLDASKGDLTDDILARLPAHVADKVVLFDADSPHPPPVLNPLDDPNPIRAVDNLVGVFARVWAASWGPRTEDILRCGLLTLTTQPGTANLADLDQLLSDQQYRTELTAGIEDPQLRQFWNRYDSYTDAYRAHITAPLTNKLRALLLRPFIAAAITGPSTVNLDNIINNGGILLARIPKGSLGTDTASLFGSLIVAGVWQAAMRRAAIPEAQRPYAHLFLDEAPQYLGGPYPISDLLTEARGYRLSLTLALQNMTQLPPELAEAISANARNKLIFAVSPEDARRLARHTHPRLTEHDLAHLDPFHLAVRPVNNLAPVPAFTAQAQPLPPPIPGRAQLIRRAALRHTPQAPATEAQPPPAKPDPRRAV